MTSRCAICHLRLDSAAVNTHATCELGHELNAHHLTAVLRLLACRLNARPVEDDQ